MPSGRFTTAWFFAGAFSITLDDGWTVEDGTNELVFEHPGPPDWLLFAWIDPYPVSHLHRVDGVDRTPDALITWLLANPTLIGTREPAMTVAGELPAGVVDLRVSDEATLEFADCPDICTNYVGFEAPGPDLHGLAHPGVTRLWFVPVTYGGQTHLLTISYEALDETVFAAQLGHAQQLIDTIRMPVEAP